MAMAATIQPSPVRTEPVKIAPSPMTISRSSSDDNRPKRTSTDDISSTRPIQPSSNALQCDACRKRQIRCALNEKTGKCYSCDFHRQDCIYSTASPVMSRKRTSEDELEGQRSRKGFVLQRTVIDRPADSCDQIFPSIKPSSSPSKLKL